MRKKFCFSLMNVFVATFLVLALMTLRAQPASAFTLFTDRCGNPFDVMGYITQSVAFGAAGEDHYDTRQGFQSALFQFLLETTYSPARNVRIFASGKINADWAYNILSDNGGWNRKEFDKSRSKMYLLHDGYEDYLSEAHVTWTPDRFYFRVGKQICAWGETDGIRLMDQINPTDTRRGITDVKFETSVIPIWLIKAAYFPKLNSTWLQDLGIEFTFNPNAHFIPNKSLTAGNDDSGIWALNVKAAKMPLPYPNDFIRMGSTDLSVKKPKAWNNEGFEYGARILSNIKDTVITLNYFYGIDNNPVGTLVFPYAPRITVGGDNRLIMHLPIEASYRLFRIAGFTLSRDFEKLYITALGGVAPVLRLEALYGFDTSFNNGTTLAIEKHDEVRYAIGIDWKVKINALNPMAFFMISSQFIQRNIMDYPHGYKLVESLGAQVEAHNYTSTMMINTSYFHNKIVPQFFWQHDFIYRANMFWYSVKYERDDRWNYTVGAFFMDGNREGVGLQPFNNKDHFYFTVNYRFS